MSIWIFLVIAFSVFSFGYYLGNQYGRTAHIREDLKRIREVTSGS